MSDFDYRVKVFIPNFYHQIWGDYLTETLQEAIKDLQPTFFKIEERDNGVYLYLFSSRLFPKVRHGDETPDASLLLGGQGWRVKWMQKIKSDIVTLH